MRIMTKCNVMTNNPAKGDDPQYLTFTHKTCKNSAENLHNSLGNFRCSRFMHGMQI